MGIDSLRKPCYIQHVSANCQAWGQDDQLNIGQGAPDSILLSGVFSFKGRCPGGFMSAQMLSAAAGILLSLLFSYVPKLNTWYAGQSDETKKLIMLGLLFVIGAGSFGLACADLLTDLFGITITCDKAGAIGLLQAFVIAAVANQTAYKLSPQTSSVKAAKEQAAG